MRIGVWQRRSFTRRAWRSGWVCVFRVGINGCFGREPDIPLWSDVVFDRLGRSSLWKAARQPRERNPTCIPKERKIILGILAGAAARDILLMGLPAYSAFRQCAYCRLC